MSLKSISDTLNIGSSPRSSEGIYNNVTEKASSMFSPNKSSAARLLSVPEKVSSSFGSSSSIGTAVSDAVSSDSATSSSAGMSFWQYLLIFVIILFLGLNLLLFLLKPANTSLTHLYDPLVDFYKSHFTSKPKGPIAASVNKKKNKAAVDKLEKALEKKEPINNIDKQTKSILNQKTNLAPEPVKKYKKLPVIPEADDSTSRIQMNPTSKSGFCYIGEDRGFRSCINVKEGDVCMSGDIFPTEAICINPRLRE